MHCLTGGAIGEVLGMVIGCCARGWRAGMALGTAPGTALGTALGLAFASDTASIAIMEIVDNARMLVLAGAMDAGLDEVTFWGSLAASLLIAGVAAFPVVRWFISRPFGRAPSAVR